MAPQSGEIWALERVYLPRNEAEVDRPVFWQSLWFGWESHLSFFRNKSARLYFMTESASYFRQCNDLSLFFGIFQETPENPPLVVRLGGKMTDKTADLAGPGIGNYDELVKDLPDNYEAILAPMERMKAVFAVKNYIEAHLCKALDLHMVQVPLIVDKSSGVNDYLDRDGSRTPVEFP